MKDRIKKQMKFVNVICHCRMCCSTVGVFRIQITISLNKEVTEHHIREQL